MEDDHHPVRGWPSWEDDTAIGTEDDPWSPQHGQMDDDAPVLALGCVTLERSRPLGRPAGPDGEDLFWSDKRQRRNNSGPGYRSEYLPV